jgi:hypothetical protein
MPSENYLPEFLAQRYQFFLKLQNILAIISCERGSPTSFFAKTKKTILQFYIFWGVLLLFDNLFVYEVCILTADKVPLPFAETS